jgi:hypothetical protein
MDNSKSAIFHSAIDSEPLTVECSMTPSETRKLRYRTKRIKNETVHGNTDERAQTALARGGSNAWHKQEKIDRSFVPASSVKPGVAWHRWKKQLGLQVYLEISVMVCPDSEENTTQCVLAAARCVQEQKLSIVLSTKPSYHNTRTIGIRIKRLNTQICVSTRLSPGADNSSKR